MKFLILFLTVFMSSYANAKSKLSFDSQYPLYLSDGSNYNFDQIDTALDRAYSYKKPVILFVHGRGNEPKKSLEGGTFVDGNAVHKLEEQYNIKVVMFNWQSKAFLYDRTKPLSHMNESALSFKKVLTATQKYLKISKNKKISLLAHSMGSIVVQTYVKNYGWEPKTRLFSNVIFTSPDADNKNHALWLDQIAKIENTFVTINQDDDILSQSTDDREKNVYALGLLPVKKYSSNTTYLDLTKMSDQPGKATGTHEIFNKLNMKGQKYVCEVMQSLLTSQNPNLKSATTSVLTDLNYLKFNFKIDSKAACFNI